MAYTYRCAIPDDIGNCMELRGQTRENAVSIERLNALGITRESWSSDVVNGNLRGYVCLDEGRIVGYCFGDSRTGEIVVLALLPDWEGRGIGRQLLNLIVQDFAAAGFQRLFLGCSSNPEVRSYGFYRHLGWRPTGDIDARQDEILEYFPAQSTPTKN